MSDVPCGSCTRCCRGDAVRILPHEDAAKWRTVAHPSGAGARMLDHKPNGDCVYLDWVSLVDGIYLRDGGCTIHDDKPQQCQDMDCRNLARNIKWTTARKLDNQGLMPMAVWQRGRELLRLELELGDGR